MQGEGKLKWQDTTGMNSSITFPGGNDPGDEGYCDGEPCGTYIEVEGYYISNTVASPGKGEEIIYRFMLGKDTERDYNAERNFHYKLTLRFRGHANDVDWHIEYDEDEGIYAPNPYYISYLYDHEMMLPLKIKGTPVGKLKAEIVENNWRPHEAGSEFEYYRGEVYTVSGNPGAGSYATSDPDRPQIKDGPWNGFLSLVKTHINWIGRSKPYWSGYNYFYWKQRPEDFGKGLGGMDLTSHGTTLLNSLSEGGFSPRGYREYDLSQSGTVPDAVDGDYIVTRNDAEGQTVVQLPFYTRAMQMTDATGFTGNNIYFAYRRSAKVRLEVQLAGHAQPTVDTITIYQVRRVVNPKGIYRRHDNDAAFQVALTHRLNEAATRYTVFESEGPWKAEVEVGKEWIKLNGVLGGTVEGSTGSEIRFTYQPAGTIGEDQSRCGIILIRYHNLACYHRIFVRQGYAPMQVAGSAKWHTFNLYYKDHETAAPCEEGSLFRFGNIDQPIDAVNNQFDRFADHATTPFRLAPTSSGLTGTWNAVAGQTRITSKSRTSDGFSDMPQTIGGRQCRVAERSDFKELQNRLPVCVRRALRRCVGRNRAGDVGRARLCPLQREQREQGHARLFRLQSCGEPQFGRRGGQYLLPGGRLGIRPPEALFPGEWKVRRIALCRSRCTLYRPRDTLSSDFLYRIHQFRRNLLVQSGVGQYLFVGHQRLDIRFQRFRKECVPDRQMDRRRRSQCQRRLLRPSGRVGGGRVPMRFAETDACNRLFVRLPGPIAFAPDI